jgi:hypothetical protein
VTSSRYSGRSGGLPTARAFVVAAAESLLVRSLPALLSEKHIPGWPGKGSAQPTVGWQAPRRKSHDSAHMAPLSARTCGACGTRRQRLIPGPALWQGRDTRRCAPSSSTHRCNPSHTLSTDDLCFTVISAPTTRDVVARARHQPTGCPREPRPQTHPRPAEARVNLLCHDGPPHFPSIQPTAWPVMRAGQAFAEPTQTLSRPSTQAMS